jgi:hypothetical protein
MGAGHVCLGPGFINKYQTLSVDLALQPSPLVAAPGDVVAILLTGVQAFF